MTEPDNSAFTFPSKDELRRDLQLQIDESILLDTQQALDELLKYINRFTNNHDDIDKIEKKITFTFSSPYGTFTGSKMYNYSVSRRVTKELLDRGYTVLVGTYGAGKNPDVTIRKFNESYTFADYSNPVSFLEILIL
jgi:hypothetical protein